MVFRQGPFAIVWLPYTGRWLPKSAVKNLPYQSRVQRVRGSVTSCSVKFLYDNLQTSITLNVIYVDGTDSPEYGAIRLV